MRWGPAKPRLPIKIMECGPGRWEENEHRLDLPGPVDTIDFKVIGTGHERIAQAYKDGCINRGTIIGFNEKQPEHRIAAWLCRNACSFVLFATSSRATVLGFTHDEDAHAFGREIGRYRKRPPGELARERSLVRILEGDLDRFQNDRLRSPVPTD